MCHVVDVLRPVEFYDSGDKVGQYSVATICTLWFYYCASKLNALSVMLEVKFLGV